MRILLVPVWVVLFPAPARLHGCGSGTPAALLQVNVLSLPQPPICTAVGAQAVFADLQSAVAQTDQGCEEKSCKWQKTRWCKILIWWDLAVFCFLYFCATHFKRRKETKHVWPPAWTPSPSGSGGAHGSACRPSSCETLSPLSACRPWLQPHLAASASPGEGNKKKNKDVGKC